MKDTITLGKLIGEAFIDEFENFDLTEVQGVLAGLASDNAIDIAHADMLQQKTLYAADLLITFISKLVKTVSFLETKINSVKNRTALEFEPPEGKKATADMKKAAGESSPEVEAFGLLLAKAKGAKTLLERKYDILIRSHHYYKDISGAQKRGIVSFNANQNNLPTNNVVGWE